MFSFMLDPSSIVPEPLSRAKYEQLVELGAFEDERVELLCGQLVTMSPQGGPHALVTAWLAQKLIRALDESYEVRSHSPYAATDDSEPEPDVSVSREPTWHHPNAALLLIEVSDSSLRKDRKKAEVYASNGAPEYWIVDLERSTVEVHTLPMNGRYTRFATSRAGDVLRPTALPQLAIAVADLPWPSADED